MPKNNKDIPDPKAHMRINTPLQRTSTTLLTNLKHINNHWLNWKGINETQLPHELTANEMAHILGDFRFHKQTIWEPGPRATAKSAKGYLKESGLWAWENYLDSVDAEETEVVKPDAPKALPAPIPVKPDTPTQPNKTNRLRRDPTRHRRGTKRHRPRR